MIIIILTIFLLVFLLILSLIPLALSLSFLFGPPFVPTPKHIVLEMFELIKLNKKDVVIDLGSGDGIVLIEAAKKGAFSKGWEINPFLVILTKIKARIYGLSDKISVYPKSYIEADLEGATAIFCYNLPKFMPKIITKIKKEAAIDVKIISYKFPIPNLKLVKKNESEIFLYTLKK